MLLFPGSFVCIAVMPRILRIENFPENKNSVFTRISRHVIIAFVERFNMQIWFIGRTLASQAGKAGSTPVICLRKSPVFTGLFHFRVACLSYPVWIDVPAQKNILFVKGKLTHERNVCYGRSGIWEYREEKQDASVEGSSWIDNSLRKHRAFHLDSRKRRCRTISGISCGNTGK